MIFLVSILFASKTSLRRLQVVFKMSSRCLKTCPQDVFKKCLEDAFSVTLFPLPRHLEDVLTSLRYLARCLQNFLKDEKLLRWRHVADIFKTFWRPTNLCWGVSSNILATFEAQFIKMLNNTEAGLKRNVAYKKMLAQHEFNVNE